MRLVQISIGYMMGKKANCICSSTDRKEVVMSNKDSDHKQMLVAKCYELALVECSLLDSGGSESVDDVETVDFLAMRFLDRIHKAADIWTKVDEAQREKKPVT